MGWMLARTHTGRELWAAENIARQGAEYYLPKFAKPLRRGSRVIGIRPELLFPNYIFARDVEGRWRFLLGTFGVAYVVCRSDESPSPVPESAINMLRGMEEDGLIQLPSKAKYRLNQQLQVKDGLFAGYTGLFQELASGDRVRVLLNVMGRKTPCVFPSAQLEPA